MKTGDVLQFSFGAASGYPTRTLLMLLAMAIGVASVILLIALGEGARRYVTREFTSLGTHLLVVLPGRSETIGGPPPLLGETPRDLTLEDALALKRISFSHTSCSAYHCGFGAGFPQATGSGSNHPRVHL